MRILIVGGTSSLSKALLPVLRGFGEVITAGRSNCDVQIDLSTPIEEMIFPSNTDVVIHTASHFGGKSSESILEAENINVIGTLKLCELSKRNDVKHFIYISSIFSSLSANAFNYSSYAMSKRHAEEAAHFYCQSYSLPLTILRPSQIYGNEKDFSLHQPFFYLLIDQAQRGENITLYGSHDPLRNYIHIQDLVEIIGKVVKEKVTGNYACAHPHDITYSEIASAAYNAFHTKGEIVFLKDKESIADNIFEKDEELYKKINFYPQISISEGVKKIANYRILNQ